MSPSKRAVRKAVAWLDGETPPDPTTAKLEKRRRELDRLEEKLWEQLQALGATVRRIKLARRSLGALRRVKRSRRKEASR